MIALGLCRMQKSRFIVPSHNAKEAASVKNADVFGVQTLKEVVDFINKKIEIEKEKLAENAG